VKMIGTILGSLFRVFSFFSFLFFFQYIQHFDDNFMTT
jgi:hypothetical protein